MPLTQEDLLEATTALRGATEALKNERRIRKIWTAVIVGSIVALTIVFAGFWMVIRSEQQTVCEAVNQSRTDSQKMLAIIVESGRDRRTPEEQARTDALFEQVVNETLTPINC